jgi:hypothetical protein
MKITQTVKNHKLAFGGGAVALIGLLSWVAFGFFGIHTAFIDDVVDEDGPVFTVSPEGSGETAAPAAEAETDDAAAVDADAVPDETSTDETSTDETEPEATEPAADEIVTLFDGSFSGLSRYDVTGDALVLNNGTEQRFLRFENFESNNGPDLKVYLRADNGDFVSLGNLSGNIGNQNYEIPADVDLAVFSTVEIWCERFSVGFGEAELSPAT